MKKEQTKKGSLGIAALRLMIAAFMVANIAGCDDLLGTKDKEGEPNPPVTADTVSWENFSSYSIKVDNKTGERLVAFKGSLNPNYLISGIPAYATQHGLKKDTALFNATGNFVMLLITESQYNANKDNLGALSEAVFARIYAFYNNQSPNNNIFEISAKIGGEGKLQISNPTSYDVEIRQDGITGPILGYAAPRMTAGNVINMQSPGVYDIYPVYKYFNQMDQELYSVIPRYSEGALVGKPFMKTVSFADGALTRSFNMNEVEGEGNFNLSSGSVYLRIVNNASVDVRVSRGNIPVNTSMGIDAVIEGRTATFTIPFEPNADKSYPDTQSISGIRIGSNQNMLLIEAQEFYLDYTYEIVVTGTSNSTLALGEVVRKDKVDLNKIFGLD